MLKTFNDIDLLGPRARRCQSGFVGEELETPEVARANVDELKAPELVNVVEVEDQARRLLKFQIVDK